jgi:hypothetical protein
VDQGEGGYGNIELEDNQVNLMSSRHRCSDAIGDGFYIHKHTNFNIYMHDQKQLNLFRVGEADVSIKPQMSILRSIQRVKRIPFHQSRVAWKFRLAVEAS